MTFNDSAEEIEFYADRYEQIFLEEETGATIGEPLIDDLKEYEIFVSIFDKLVLNKTEDKLELIGSSLKGYLTEKEVGNVYDILAEKYEDICYSDNAYNIILSTFHNDSYPCNLGLLYKHYNEHDLDKGNLKILKKFLESKLNQRKYKQFQNEKSKYNNVIDMLEKELFDYVDNTENIFKGIIHCLMGLYGYGSRFLIINGGSEVGKSEYVNTLKKLMVNFENLGSSTPASVRRQNTHAFDKKIVYLGDKGLKGQSENAKQEFEGLYEVFGGLITDKEFKRDLVEGNEVLEFNLISEGLVVLFTQPYTNLREYKAGDQYTTRSTYITVNPVKDTLNIVLQDDNVENKFYDIHKGYINYIIENPLDLEISDDIKIVLHDAVNGSLRNFKYFLALFKAYCQYLQIAIPNINDVNRFLKLFKPPTNISDIEMLVYKKLYKNLKPLQEDEVIFFLGDWNIYNNPRLLKQRKDRKDKCFFTSHQIKTYFRQEFRRNNNLKDVIDFISDILRNLYNEGYLGKLEEKYNNENVYYLLFNKDME